MYSNGLYAIDTWNPNPFNSHLNFQFLYILYTFLTIFYTFLCGKIVWKSGNILPVTRFVLRGFIGQNLWGWYDITWARTRSVGDFNFSFFKYQTDFFPSILLAVISQKHSKTDEALKDETRNK